MREIGDPGEPLNSVADYSLDELKVRRYLTYMKTTISTKGQIVLPAEFRQLDDIEPGEEFEIER